MKGCLNEPHLVRQSTIDVTSIHSLCDLTCLIPDHCGRLRPVTWEQLQANVIGWIVPVLVDEPDKKEQKKD